MKIKQGIFAAIYFVVWVLITFFSYRDERPYDGPLSLGFPLPFYLGGGMCLGPCGPNLMFGNLLLDILVFLTPVIVSVWYFKRKME